MSAPTLVRVDSADLRELARNAGWTHESYGHDGPRDHEWRSPAGQIRHRVALTDGRLTVLERIGYEIWRVVVEVGVRSLADAIAALYVARLIGPEYLTAHTCVGGRRCHGCDLEAERAAQRRAEW